MLQKLEPEQMDTHTHTQTMKTLPLPHTLEVNMQLFIE